MNSAAGIATGTAVGISTGLAMKAAAEDEARRKSHMSEDQIVFKTKYKPSVAKIKIASLFSNFKINDDEQIIRTKDYPFDIFGFGVTIVGLPILFFIWYMIYDISHHFNSDFYFSLNQVLVFSGITALIIGLYYGNEDDVVNYIAIDTIKNETHVQIKMYDSSGYRNVDDIELMRIQEILE